MTDSIFTWKTGFSFNLIINTSRLHLTFSINVERLLVQFILPDTIFGIYDVPLFTRSSPERAGSVVGRRDVIHHPGQLAVRQ